MTTHEAFAALARTGRVADADLSDKTRAALFADGARLFAGSGAAWWGAGEAPPIHRAEPLDKVLVGLVVEDREPTNRCGFGSVQWVRT